MKISISELRSYRKCPLYYQFKYVDGIQEEQSISQELDEKLHRLIYYFYYRIMNKDIPHLESVKRKWNSLWYGNMDPMEYILTPKNDRSEAGHKALPMIDNFYKSNCSVPGMPLAIEQEFTVRVGDHEVSGILELVREIQDGPRRVIEIIDYKTGTQVPIQWNVDYDLYLSLQSYAFRTIFGAKEQRTLAHYLRSNRVFVTYRSQDHYERMASTVDQIAKSIYRGLFYPQESYMCNSCYYKNYCTVWK